MKSFHINDDGDVKECSAVKEESCPFNKDNPHFTSSHEAQKHYENTAGKSFDVFGKPLPKRTSSIKTKEPSLRKVFRVGLMTPPDYSTNEDLEEMLYEIDDLRPDGRQGRRGGLFASPDMKSHSHWLKGARYSDQDTDFISNELVVDADSVFVYRVADYEEATDKFYSANEEPFKEAVKRFWNSGMTLTEWEVWSKTNKNNPADWEIIMTPQSVVSSRQMTNSEVVKNVPEDDAQLVSDMLWRK